MQNNIEHSHSVFEMLYNNGLPYKPIIESDYQLLAHRDPNNIIDFLRFSSILNYEQLNYFNGDFSCIGIHHIKNSTIEYWFDFPHCYIVFAEDNPIVEEQLKNNNVGITIKNKENKLVFEY